MAVSTRHEALRILEIDPQSDPSDDDIRKTYKRLARQHHPDKNLDDPSATAKFQLVGEAYKFLTESWPEEVSEAYFQQDDDLIDLFELFMHLQALRKFSNPFDSYYGLDDYDDDRSYYVHEQCGCQHHHVHNSDADVQFINQTFRRGKGKSNQQQAARQPSQKWYRKMMKRQYNAEREEYEAEYGEKENVPKPAKSYNNKKSNKRTTQQSKPEPENETQKPSTEQAKPKQPEPRVVKKPTKKQLEAENVRRQKEIEQIAKDLEERQKREAEKEAKRQEKERQRQEELRTQSSFLPVDKIPPMKKTSSTKNGENTKKSGKKTNQQEKKKKKIKDEKEIFDGRDDKKEMHSRDILLESGGDTDTSMPRKNRNNPQPQQGPGVLKISQNNSQSTKTIYRQDSSGSESRGGFDQSQQSNKQKSYYERTKQDYRQKPKEHSNFVGVSQIKSPSRPQQSQSTGAWGRPKPAGGPAWGQPQPAGNAWGSTNTYSQQACSFDNDDWDESGGFSMDSRPPAISRNVAPAPAPQQNVWQQRMEFYQSALPNSEMEEERMLQAALEMSRLQEEEEKLRLKLDQEEHSGAAAPPALDSFSEPVAKANWPAPPPQTTWPNAPKSSWAAPPKSSWPATTPVLNAPTVSKSSWPPAPKSSESSAPKSSWPTAPEPRVSSTPESSWPAAPEASLPPASNSSWPNSANTSDSSAPESSWPTAPVDEIAPEEDSWIPKEPTPCIEPEWEKPKAQGFMRGIGRTRTPWNQPGSRNASMPSKSHSEPLVANSPSRPEPPAKVKPAQTKPEEMWDSGSDCDDDWHDASSDLKQSEEPSVGKETTSGPNLWDKASGHIRGQANTDDHLSRAQISYNNSASGQGDAFSAPAPTSTVIGNIPPNLVRDKKPTPQKQESDISAQPPSSVPNQANPSMNGIPSEAALRFGRGIQRKYGPRARRAAPPQASIPAPIPTPIPTPTPTLPGSAVTVSVETGLASPTSSAPPALNAYNLGQVKSMAGSSFPAYNTEDTSAKLRDLVNRVAKAPTEIKQDASKKNMFCDLEEDPENSSGLSDLKSPVVDSSQRMGDRVLPNSSLPLFPSSAPLDLTMPSSSSQSNFNSFQPANTNSNPTSSDVANLGSQLGGLKFGGNIWSGYPGNEERSWGSSGVLVGEVKPSVHPQPQRAAASSSGESAGSTPASSPDLSSVAKSPTAAANTNKEKPYNPVGSIPSEIGSYLGYNHPYMNMPMPMMVPTMPQMYPMGYQPMSMPPTMGLGGLSMGGSGSGGTDGPARQSPPFAQVPGMIPYGMMPGVMPHMSVPMVPQRMSPPTADAPNNTSNNNNSRPAGMPSPPTAPPLLAPASSVSSSQPSTFPNRLWDGNHMMNGRMPQYNLPYGIHSKIPSAQPGGEGVATGREHAPGQPHPQAAANNNPMVLPGMQMMQGIPFLPTMPLMPQQYGSMGSQDR